MQRFDVIVVGQGYAGLRVAKLAAERGLKTAVAEKMFPGGLVMSVNDLHPAPEGTVPSGPELTGDLALTNMDLGVVSLEGETTALAPGSDGDWRVTVDGQDHLATNVVVASGARLRKLGVPGEAAFAGMGVSECADCDGPMYQDKEGVIVGGGDSAFQEAEALAAYASRVTIVMRGTEPRARPDLVAAVAANPKVTVLPDAQVTEILGDGGVTGVRVRKGDGAEVELPCAVVFVFIGLRPDVDFLPADIARDEGGAVVTADDLGAGRPGLWAVGAVRSGFGGLMSDADVDAARVVAAI